MENRNQTVLDLFYRSVAIYPHKKAVVFEGEGITYEELNSQSNILAKKMQEQGVKQQDFILLTAKKSLEMVIGIIASLKVGAIYVPIDLRYPVNRIKYIINDCKPILVLRFNTDLEFSLPVIDITINREIVDNSILNNYPHSIDYCIYTSGTTGNPKGVLIYDYSILNLVQSYHRIYGITQNDILLQFASIAFDQSVWDIFTILTSGGTLCIFPDNYINDIKAIEKYINENSVTVAAFTPAFLKLLNPNNLNTLRVVESGGDRIEKTVVEKWLNHCIVFNTYGPTEATVNALSYKLQSPLPDEIPIGKPIDNVQVYIVKDNNEACVDEEIGEICLSGKGIAKGYLNNPALTKEKFINNPFGEGVLYRTGDLGKRNKDGYYFCLGRIDSEVKIRGFRIELGEIESLLRSYGDVFVSVEQNQLGNNIIVAYIVSNTPKEELVLYLKHYLPDYMIPSEFIFIPFLPLNVNGKIDRVKLHSLYKEQSSHFSQNDIPETEFQAATINIIKEILNLETFQLGASFTEHGGDSISAVHVVTILNDMGFSCSAVDLLNSDNIKVFEDRTNIRRQSTKACDYSDERDYFNRRFEVKIRGISLLSPTQRYMYRAYKRNILGDNFLQYVYAFKFDYNYLKFRKSIHLLSKIYDSLTSNFIEHNGVVYQVTFYEKEIPINEVFVKSGDEMDSHLEKDVLESFNIADDPLIRFTIFRFPSGEKKLLCSVSHMIVDGWSVEIVLHSLSRIYSSLLKGEEIVLEIIPNISIYNNTLVQHISTIQKEAVNYWNDYFRGSKNGIITIPHDSQGLSVGYHNVVKYISKHDFNRIKMLCHKMGVTENSFFEVAYAYLLKRFNLHQEDILFSKVVSGRDLSVHQIDKMVGTFINIIPQRVVIRNDYINDIKNLHNSNMNSIQYDKIDFYETEIDGRILMDNIQSMLVFSNFYEEDIPGLVYEFDKDQDDIDFTFYIDEMRDTCRIYFTGKKECYSIETAEDIAQGLIDVIHEIVHDIS